MDIDVLLSRLDADYIFPIVMTAIVFGSITLWTLIKTLGSTMVSIKERTIAAKLVNEMLQQNMNSEQISQVLASWNAQPPGNSSCDWQNAGSTQPAQPTQPTQPVKPAKPPKAIYS